MRTTTRLLTCFCAVFWVSACGDADPVDGDGGTDADTDTDTDADAGEDGGESDCENPEHFNEGTGIYWLQCLAGQCLVDDACVWEGGEAVSFDYAEAAAACPSGTRLPTMDELMGLLGTCDAIDFGTNMTGFCSTCSGSTAYDAIYPGTEELDLMSPEAVHWSSTALNDSKMWRANFLTGLVDATLKEMNATGVCVRSE